MKKIESEIVHFTKADVTVACEKHARDWGIIGEDQKLKMIELNSNFSTESWVTAEVSEKTNEPKETNAETTVTPGSGTKADS